jgi:hypothetical protein
MKLSFPNFLVLATLIVVFVILCFGCGGSDWQKGKNEEVISSIRVITYDSCEYLVSGFGYSQMITHKGNCKFCAARQIQQMGLGVFLQNHPIEIRKGSTIDTLIIYK